MKIILTNWINLLGIFLVCAFAEAIVLTLTKVNNIFGALIISLMAVFGYGMMFFIFLIIGIAVLDLVLIVPNQKNLRLKLIIEWMIISSPFVYWTIEYGEWIFAVGIVSFLITQLLREKYILKKGLR